ncbi:UNVERIFIED_CONTAM: hypothetical protein FKN15_003666 [Acipenser sinensis]
MLRLPHSGHSGSPLLGIGRWGSSHLGDGRSCSSHLGVGHLGSSHYRCCGQQWFPVSLFVNPVHDLGHPLHCFHQPWISSADPFSLDLGIQLDLIQEDIQVAVPQQMSPLCSQPQRDESQEIFKPSLPTAPKSTPAPSTAYNKTARPFGATAAPKAASIPSASSAFTPASTPHSFAASPPPPFATAAAPPPPAVYASTNAKPILDGHVPPPSAAKVTVAPSVNVPPQPSVYNTPINLYSNNNACEVAEGQRRGLNQKGAAQHNG